MATTSNYALRLLASLKTEAEEAGGTAQARYFEERALAGKAGRLRRMESLHIW